MQGGYELLGRWTRGGMAELHLAHKIGIAGFRRLVVIKRILPHLADNVGMSEMFLREAKIAASLAHPNICQVVDVGLDDEGPYLAMEYLEGVSLAELLAELPKPHTTTQLRVLIGIFLQVAAGLDAAHNHRDAGQDTLNPIVHRDVSPHNIFITRAGICKLLDFGVAKVLADKGSTGAGTVKGKLAYMAPEQARAERVDARADVFSYGVVLWEALTGHALFSRSSDFLVWQAVLADHAVAPSEIRPELSRDFDALVLRALAKQKEERTASIAEVSAALSRASTRLGGPASPAEIAALVEARCGKTLAENTHRREAACRNRTPAASIQAANDAGARAIGDTTTHATIDGFAPAIESTSSEAQGTAIYVSPRVAHQRARRRRSWVAGLAFVALCSGSVWWFVSARMLAMPRIAVTDGAAVDARLVADARPVVSPPLANREPAPSTYYALQSVSPPRDAPADVAPADDASADVAPAGVAPADVVPAEPVRRAAPARLKEKPVASSPTNAHGSLTIDATPYATVYAGTVRLGDTPLFRVRLPVGQKSIRLTRPGKRSKSLVVQIAKDKETNVGTVRW